ncbi:MAG: hypothetical protein ACE5JI_21415 [Acidobacteriota bacterium]
MREETLERARGAQAARRLEVALRPIFEARERRILNRLVSEHRSRTLTHEMTLGLVGAVAEMRSILSELKTKSASGQGAEEKLGRDMAAVS